MNPRRFWRILLAASVVIGAALLLGHFRRESAPVEGKLLVPQLSGQWNSVTGVTIRKGSSQPAVTLQKKAGHWTVEQRADYPADTAKLRKLLLACADARVIEQKTSDPANYHALGVEDPTTPDTIGTEITIATPASTQTFIVGKPTAGGSFVRFWHEAGSVLVSPGLAVDAEARDWIDTRVLDVKAADIQQIEIKPVRGASFKRKATEFDALTALTALDVAPLESVDFKGATTASITLGDGSVISLAAVVAQDKHWLSVASSKDSALNDRARGRAYEIGASRYDSIFKP